MSTSAKVYLPNLLNANLKIACLLDTYTPSNSHHFLSDISTHEVSGTGYTARALTGKTLTESNGLMYFNADDLIPGGSLSYRYAVAYEDTGNPATSPLYYFIDFGTNVSTSQTIQWDANGLASYPSLGGTVITPVPVVISAPLLTVTANMDAPGAVSTNNSNMVSVSAPLSSVTASADIPVITTTSGIVNISATLSSATASSNVPTITTANNVPSFAPANNRTITRYSSNPISLGSLPAPLHWAKEGNYYYGTTPSATGSGTAYGPAIKLLRMNLDYTGVTDLGNLFAINSAGFETGLAHPHLFKDTLDGDKWKVVFIGIGSSTGFLPYVAVGTTTITDAMTVNTNPIVTRGTNSGTSFDYTNIQYPYMAIDGSTYYLYYSGYNSTYNTLSNLAIGLATGSALASTGAHSFTKQGRKIQLPGGYFGEVGVGSIYKYTDNNFYFALHGIDQDNTPADFQIYYASTLNPAEDGYTKAAGSYLMTKTGANGEVTSINWPNIIPNGTTGYKILYTGRNASVTPYWYLCAADMT